MMKKIGLGTFIFILLSTLIALLKEQYIRKTVENFFKISPVKKIDQVAAMVYLCDLNDAKITQAKEKIICCLLVLMKIWKNQET